MSEKKVPPINLPICTDCKKVRFDVTGHCTHCGQRNTEPVVFVPAKEHLQVGVEGGLDQLERWMVDYEGEEGGPVETQLSWITGPGGDPTTKRPDVGDYLVRLEDVRRLLAEHPLESEGAGERLLAGIDSGDLTRTILEELEAPCDDPEHPSPQMGIQARIEGWFYTVCWSCKKRVPTFAAEDWEERPCPDNGEYECSWCPGCVAGEASADA